MNPVSSYPVLVATVVAGIVIAVLAHVTGEVPQDQQDNIQAFASWFVPIAISLIAGLFAHRRVTPVPPEARGF